MTTETKLPVWRTVADAYRFMFRSIKPFFAMATMPILFLTAISLVNLIRYRGFQDQPPMTLEDIQQMPLEDLQQMSLQYLLPMADVPDPWSSFEMIASYFIWCVFAVSWHRFILLGRRDSADMIQFETGRREIKFFLYTLLFIAPMIVVPGVIFVVVAIMYPTFSDILRAIVELGIVFINAVTIAVTVALFIYSAVWIRCLLIFPAIAVGADEGLPAAWKQLRGATWRFSLAMSIAYLPFFIFFPALAILSADYFMSAPVITPFDWKMGVIFIFVQQFLGFLSLALGVTILSFTFRHKSGWVAPA